MYVFTFGQFSQTVLMQYEMCVLLWLSQWDRRWGSMSKQRKTKLISSLPVKWGSVTHRYILIFLFIEMREKEREREIWEKMQKKVQREEIFFNFQENLHGLRHSGLPESQGSETLSHCSSGITDEKSHSVTPEDENGRKPKRSLGSISQFWNFILTPCSGCLLNNYSTFLSILLSCFSDTSSHFSGWLPPLSVAGAEQYFWGWISNGRFCILDVCIPFGLPES